MGKFVPIGQVKNGHDVVSSKHGSFTPIGSVRKGDTKPEEKKDEGGLVGRFFGDLKDFAVHAPGGIADTASTVGKTFYYDARYGPTSKKATAQRKKLAELEGVVVSSTADTVKHPLRHPGDTFITALGLASGGAGAVARVVEAGKVIKAADGVSKAGKAKKAAGALATRPSQGVRTFSHDGVTATKSGSRNALIRHAQKQVLDPLRHAFPDAPHFGSAATVGRLLEKDERRAKRMTEAEAGTFTKSARQAGMLKRTKGRKDALARQHAMRVVAEGVPVSQRIKTHNDFLNRGYNAAKGVNPEVAAFREKQFVKGHNEQLGLNEAASKYVKTVRKPNGDLVPTFTKAAHDAGIAAAYTAMKELAGSREALLEKIGKLEEDTKAGRYAAPGREFFGGGEDFAGGEVRVPTVPKGRMTSASKAVQPQVGAQGVVNGVPKEIASVYKPYLGKAYKGGAVRTDVVRLMHETWQEAQRYYTLLHVTDRLKGAAKPWKSSKHDILIKTEEIPGQPAMKAADALMNPVEGAYQYESVRQRIFPDVSGGVAKNAPIGTEPPPGYQWVDSRLLGGLNKRNPLLGFYDYKIVRGALKTNDAINNASKLAILYLKPAYIAPNLLGNAAMVLLQQGFAAPKNIARAARLNAEADLKTVSRVDAAMGEGVVGSLEGSGLTQKATHAAANFYSKFVDVAFRRAAFLHEAAREGFDGKNLASLFEPGNEGKLKAVTDRANTAMIDYGDLNGLEQGVVRRVIFFYPWVKGATKYTVQFIPEHPVTAAALVPLAQRGKEQQALALGDELPSWAEGLIPTGQANGLPTTVNPAGISVLSTLPELVNGVRNHEVSQNLSPALALVQAMYDQGVRPGLKDQAQSLPEAPILGLARDSKTFPYERTPQEAILLYLLGSGLTPRETDPAQLHKQAGREKQGGR